MVYGTNLSAPGLGSQSTERFKFVSHQRSKGSSTKEMTYKFKTAKETKKSTPRTRVPKFSCYTSLLLHEEQFIVSKNHAGGVGCAVIVTEHSSGMGN